MDLIGGYGSDDDSQQGSDETPAVAVADEGKAHPVSDGAGGGKGVALPPHAAQPRLVQPAGSAGKRKAGEVRGYVPKRARLLQAQAAPDDPPLPIPALEEVPPEVREAEAGRKRVQCALPRGAPCRLRGHTGGVSRVAWSPKGHLLASAGMDGKACVWNPSVSLDAVVALEHTESVSAVQWAHHGDSLVTGGMDRQVRLWDARTSRLVHAFAEEHRVTAIAVHPGGNVFVCGTAGAHLHAWDTRQKSIATHYRGMHGKVQSICFLRSAERLMTSTDVTLRNSTDKSLVVWDYKSGQCLASHLFPEAYSISCIAAHPHHDTVVCQTHGNYIARFSAVPPYKMDKRRRFEGHQVSGYGMSCCVSPDGQLVGTGSADGQVLFYSWASDKVIKRMRAHSKVVMDCQFHPFLPTTVATCSWDCGVCVFK